ncbi:hypothetical protein DFH09DRAFT_1103375 [Mycena vulgaris]|nr:hypothetical protein DFH09DRAFT_1103375 [Mycena vulgaris]
MFTNYVGLDIKQIILLGKSLNYFHPSSQLHIWVSDEFDARAWEVYEHIGTPKLVLTQGWAIFRQCFPISAELSSTSPINSSKSKALYLSAPEAQKQRCREGAHFFLDLLCQSRGDRNKASKSDSSQATNQLGGCVCRSPQKQVSGRVSGWDGEAEDPGDPGTSSGGEGSKQRVSSRGAVQGVKIGRQWPSAGGIKARWVRNRAAKVPGAGESHQYRGIKRQGREGVGAAFEGKVLPPDPGRAGPGPAPGRVFWAGGSEQGGGRGQRGQRGKRGANRAGIKEKRGQRAAWGAASNGAAGSSEQRWRAGAVRAGSVGSTDSEQGAAISGQAARSYRGLDILFGFAAGLVDGGGALEGSTMLRWEDRGVGASSRGGRRKEEGRGWGSNSGKQHPFWDLFDAASIDAFRARTSGACDTAPQQAGACACGSIQIQNGTVHRVWLMTGCLERNDLSVWTTNAGSSRSCSHSTPRARDTRILSCLGCPPSARVLPPRRHRRSMMMMIIIMIVKSINVLESLEFTINKWVMARQVWEERAYGCVFSGNATQNRLSDWACQIRRSSTFNHEVGAFGIGVAWFRVGAGAIGSAIDGRSSALSPNPAPHFVGTDQLRNIVVPFRVIIIWEARTNLEVGGDTVHDNGEGGSTELEEAGEDREPVLSFLGEDGCCPGGVECETDVTVAVFGNCTYEGHVGILVQPP